MSISIFDLFSIGIGPSSSHTVGPMRAAICFLEKDISDIRQIKNLTIELYGSLAFTGKGHGTDRAIIMGLCGEQPDSIDPQSIPRRLQLIEKNQQINLLNRHTIPFNSEKDILYNYIQPLKHHSNGMRFTATLSDGTNIKSTYYSIGGGFIQHEQDFIEPMSPTLPLTHPFNSAADLLTICRREQLNIHDVMLKNELAWRDETLIHQDLMKLYQAMMDCIDRGCETEGNLEGRLGVKRRAPGLYQRLVSHGPPTPDHPQKMSWLNAFAMAVNEENAAGGRVVTAPTNGAAGIIPAVLRYYIDCMHGDEDGIKRFLLTAGAIGILYKTNASISGAEMGCQGEVGVACSMAAAALTAALNGTPEQVENAAEIGMEHNLGLTCDPIDGLVQIPCIERNAMGALKAVNATNLALAGDGTHHVSLDAVIKTMAEIGRNMNSIYKETSQGGLAVNVIEC